MTRAERARRRAFNTPDLFPIDCLEILKQEYRRKLEYMKPNTIHSLIENMMRTHTDCIDHQHIEQIVQDYCNDF